ncbi:DUF4844 domain-containing protein [Flavobacterium sp.]|uniref:DUF4844 domain-containing protein n=1 Tax=Flavobacterium sp. TaxID=239 RepID=UPI0025B9F9C3|nr:DUF4844 domain-containing protein [Flavobacterium sp.]MBA4276086.1 DUF4844 domain-containing protein [Flavobacterium sp.]
MKRTILFILAILSLNACGQNQMKTPNNAMDKFEKFKTKEKFVEDNTIHYPGIADKKMRPILNEKINKVAEGFKKIAQEKNPTEKEYQNEIKIGLESFTDIYLNLDTEDRERVCSYFEEIMDIVGLESSNGQLNNFVYGFDPTKIQKQ